ncbi:signal peptidase II [Paenibacillus chitinolyticus]|uniref:Lipoprotein signal peptidase n=1 Tax=Paenibacillus chitinolyticus TaxID=79263 RepID=A0A410X0V7_9BACL|nr:signal peptidase II [Paenibacillus chitinolyticus]MCY9588580.1 signal peptidase II [Paenibacillus chitinolyticus]MCY9597950.1 signal peptidase II [Paenibacillus chitinolyticus]MEC0246648.1 signal peptidase II [Paenibacillus chitinolyticus]QAV20326.1 lipoprotein signal peptidase [Paenibacillus chitinolyticus]
MYYYLLALIVFLIDQGTKWLVVKNIPLHDSIPVIGEFFQLTSHRNRGAAFGILQDQRWFFILATLIIVVGVVLYLNRTRKAGQKLMSLALALLLGGAVGNFLDRLLFGEVVDFLQLHFQFSFFGKAVDYIYPIFNIADSAIVIGVILIFIDSIISWKNEKRGTAS